MDPTDLSDDQLDQLAQQLAGRLPTGTHGDRVVLSRRQALAVASGTVSLGALLGLGSDSALAQASADTSDGTVRGNGGGADVYLDQLRDPGGDEVLNVDDTGAINAQPREWVFDSVSTAKTNVESTSSDQNISDLSGVTLYPTSQNNNEYGNRVHLTGSLSGYRDHGAGIANRTRSAGDARDQTLVLYASNGSSLNWEAVKINEGGLIEFFDPDGAKRAELTNSGDLNISGAVNDNQTF
jgi:hypothetical protein